MADQSGGADGDQMSSTPTGAGKSPATSSKLDNLSREELTKFVKRQMLMMKKSQTKCEELTKTVTELESRIDGQSEKSEQVSILQDQIKELEEEKKEILTAYNAVQQSQEQCSTKFIELENRCREQLSEKEKIQSALHKSINHSKELEEQVECMKMKDETLSSSLQFMQEEQSKIITENQSLKEQVILLTEARDQVIEKFKTMKQQETSTESNQKLELQEIMQEKERLTQQLKDMESQMMQEKNELTQEFSEKENKMLEERNKLVQQLQETKNQAQEKQENFEKVLEEMINQKNELEKKGVLNLEQTQLVFAEKEKEFQARLEEITQEKQEMAERLKMERDEHQKNINVLRSSQENFQQTFADTNLSMQQLIEEKEKLIEQKKEVVDENQKLMDSLESKNVEIAELQQNIMEQSTISMSANNGSEKLEEISMLYDNLRKEKNSLEEKLRGQEESISSLKKELEIQKESTMSIKHENEMLHSKHSSVEEELRKTKSLLDSEQNFKCDLQNEIDNLTFQLHELQENENELKSSNESLKSRCNELESKSPQAKPATVKTNGGKGNTNVGKGNSSPRGNGATGKVIDPKKKVQILTREKELVEQDLRKAVKAQENLTYEVSELQEEKEIMRNEYHMMKEQMDEWEHMMNMLQEDKNRILHELDESDIREKKLVNDIDSVKELLGIKKELLSEEREEEEKGDDVDDVFDTPSAQDSVAKDFDKIMTEIQHLLAAKTKLQEELDEMYSKKGDSSVEIQSIKREIHRLEEEKNEVEREKESMSVLLHLKQDKEQEVSEENSGLRKTIEEQCTEIEKFKENLISLHEKVKGLEQKNEELLKESQMTKDDKKILEEKVKEGQIYTEELENKILDMSKNLSESKTKHEQFIAKMETDGESTQSLLHTEISDLKTKYEQSESLKTEAEKSLEELRKEISLMHEKIQTLTAEEKVQTEKFDQICIEKEQMLAEKAEMEKTNTHLEEKIKFLSSQIEDINVRDGHIQSSLKNLTDELEQKDNYISSLEAEKIGLAKERESFKTDKEAEVEDIKLKCQKFHEQCELLKNENKEYQESSAAYRKKIDELQTLLSQKEKRESNEVSREIQILNTEKENMKAEIESKCSEILSLKNEYECQTAESTSKIEEIQNEITKSKKLIEELSRNLKEKEKLCLENSEIIQSIKAEKDDIVNKCAETECQLQAEKQKILDTEAEVSKLREDLSQKDRIIEDYSRKFMDAMNENEKFQGRVQALQQSLEAVKSDSESKQNDVIQKMMVDIQGKEEIIKSNNETLEKLYSEIDIIKTENGNIKEMAHRMEEEKQTTETERENLSKEKEQIIYEKLELEKHLKKLEEKLAASESYLAEAVTSRDDAMIKLTELSGKESEIKQMSEFSKDEVETVKKTLREKEEMITKLKSVAMKSKKESAVLKTKLDEANTEMSKVKEMNSALQQNLEHLEQTQKSDSDQLTSFEALSEEKNFIETQLETKTKEVEEIQTDLDRVIKEMASTKESLAILHDEKETIKRENENKKADVKKLESTLTEIKSKLKTAEQERDANKIQRDQLSQENQQIQTKLTENGEKMKSTEEKHKSVVTGLQNQIQDIQKQLEMAKQEAKQSSMMDLEFADYERTIEALNAQLATKDVNITELKTEVERLEGGHKSLKEQLDSVEELRNQAEDRGNKIKQMLVKTKKELADAKKLEAEQRTSEAQLRGQMESLNQQFEDYKMQMAEISGNKQKLQEKLRTVSDSNSRTIKSLEGRIQTLQDDLDVSKSELMAAQAEYDSYKVRVHSVLKQQKKGSPDVVNEGEKIEKERLEKAIDQLKSKLQETSEKLTSSEQDNEMQQEEHSRLLTRHNKLLQDLQEKESNFKQRIDELGNEKAVYVKEQQETIRQLTKQNENVSSTFKEQIKSLKEDHHRVINILQRQLDMSDNDNMRLQQEIQQLSQQPQRPLRTELVTPLAVSPAEYIPDMRQEERQEGEGSEIVDPSPQFVGASKALGPVPLDQLLVSGPEDKLVKEQLHTDVGVLRENLDTANKRIEHLTELSSENEATVMRLEEQAKILKEEIRRLERNQQREKEAANMEYLKNILLKFLSLNVGVERQQLVPVLTTMLKLSPDEKGKLDAIAQGDDRSDSHSAQQQGGWGSYLHRWSGLT